MALNPGEIIEGKYRVTRLLGAGGMGAVYEALNTRIGRRVAIKVLHSGAGAQDALRFEQEAQAASRIGSRNIVEVFDLGNLDGNAQYMVMEYLEGETLAARVRTKGRLTARDVIPIAHQILEGLKAAHAAGIVHRDLKPDNVFLVSANEGAPDYVKLLDFGISKMHKAGEGPGLTRPGFAIGTPHFMSPEQFCASDEVDSRADLYAVGVLIYYCMSGELPFRAQNFEALMVKILSEDAAPLSSRVHALRAAWDSLVATAMARSPNDRFQSAAEFQAALAKCPAGRLGQATTVSIAEAPRTAIGDPTPGVRSSAAEKARSSIGRATTDTSVGPAAVTSGQGQRSSARAAITIAVVAFVTTAFVVAEISGLLRRNDVAVDGSKASVGAVPPSSGAKSMSPSRLANSVQAAIPVGSASVAASVASAQGGLRSGRSLRDLTPGARGNTSQSGCSSQERYACAAQWRIDPARRWETGSAQSVSNLSRALACFGRFMLARGLV